MSLVAYGSSDDSDSEESPNSTTSGSKGRLCSVLPAPKKPSEGKIRPSVKTTKANAASEDIASNDNPQPFRGGLFSSLPKPRKRNEPVRITVPQIEKRDSDSDDDEPTKKKQVQGGGSGLSALLPQPKNMTIKEKDRALIPHTLTKRQEPKAPKPGAPSSGLLGSSASPSAIKAAAKSAAMQLARQIANDDQDEEDITPQNYFSLEDNSQSNSALVSSLEPEPRATPDPLQLSTIDEPGHSDAPLDFGGNQEGSGAWGGQYGQYQESMAGPEAVPEGYYGEPYYQDPNLEQAETETEEPGNSAMFDEEAFMRLQGKRNRGKEEITFLEIKGDDQLSGTQQWLTKSMSEEKQNRQSHSKKRGGQPTGQQRRKHQITYLIHQAKERELELKNSWAENKLTRRQTQAKYGF